MALKTKPNRRDHVLQHHKLASWDKHRTIDEENAYWAQKLSPLCVYFLLTIILSFNCTV